MSRTPFQALVLAAGKGTRMRSGLPKVLHRLAGRPMLQHVLTAVERLLPLRTVLVAAPDNRLALAQTAPESTVVVQDPPLGTGHAVMCARPLLEHFQGDVLVLYGDTPLIRPETLNAMLARRREGDDPAVVVLGFRPADAAEYGRLLTDGAGMLERIVEFREAASSELAVGLCNSGVMAIDGAVLPALLDRLRNDNAKGEYYLTNIVAIARAIGRAAAVVEGEADEVLGVNSRSELAAAEAVIQQRLRRMHMDNGVTLIDPASTWFCADTRLAQDVVVGPSVVFGPGVEVGEGVEILPFSHLEGCRVAAGARIGPFARLRPGAQLGEGVHVGNFVELKNAKVENGAKINHLSYVGDARVGAKANVGAGTITCNYDGFGKAHTEIGAGAFIGSNTALVAPVKVGDGAIVGAGSVIAEDVPADALAMTRGPLTQKEGYAAEYRRRRSKSKVTAIKS
ncbi:MAG: bifunctional UDP-N-acetylglucosamine diphosphorylase/glucosamine-1-phosphate N-acetyltransferase GlmU [Alphaproteobacteria bacterium]|nr:bifunctional UDP-N-acetylglucosamine diphosphorylase/glucosamine-1-phosphate N-acetyltransferase GlmU [Alphaproteobacteria bacterium]